MNKLLDRLASNEFAMEVSPYSTPRVLYDILLRHPLVEGIKTAYRDGVVTEADIRSLVEGIVSKFNEDIMFPHEETLAALAVVLSSFGDDFALEYIVDLAELNRTGFSYCSRVAGYCLEKMTEHRESSD